MNTREKFKKKVIELIHGCSYEEAVKIEGKFGRFYYLDPRTGSSRISEVTDLRSHITIARVLQALENKGVHFFVAVRLGTLTIFSRKKVYETFCCAWELTKDNGQEADDDFQTDETIEKLLNLLDD